MNESASVRTKLLGASVFLALLAFAAVLSLRMRFRAWPEVLVPSYLCGRGWLLYRDVKVVHSPLLIGSLAAVSRIAGFSARSLRILGFLPLLAILFELQRYGRVRNWGRPAQVSASLFFILTFFVWDGNAIYPEVFLAVLAIPIFAALRRGEDRDLRRAGWLFGVALMVKQPSVFVLLFAAGWLLFHRRARLFSFFLRAAAVPATCAVFFLIAGAGREFLRWTLVVPVVYYRGRTSLAIQSAQIGTVVAGLLPLFGSIAVAVWRPGTRRHAILLLGLIATFLLLAFPHFEMVHLVAAVPLLAVAAGEVLFPGTSAPPHPVLLRSAPESHPLPRGRGKGEGTPRFAGETRLVEFAAWTTVGLSILLNAAYLATDSSAGEMSFWSSKQNEAILGRLTAFPPAPLFLYGLDQNLFVRSGRLPPGGIYSNPDLWIHYLVDGLEERQVRTLRGHPETIVLKGTRTPIETARRILPRFLATYYESESFMRGEVERLRPLPAPPEF